MRARIAVASILCALLPACEQVEQVMDELRDQTPHEVYLASLEQSGLAGSALAGDWMRAATLAVERPHLVELPFQEEGYLPPERPSAVGYRFSLQRGERLTIRTEVDAAEDSLLVFVDFFRVPEDSQDPLRPVAGVDTVAAGHWVYEPNRSGDFVLRIQPELLRGGRYRLRLSPDPSLAFPVEGGGPQDIGSGFGAERDGGARSHAGVDIFAPRGTPALAAAAGVVSRVQVTGLGGKVVWIQDEKRNARLYYAHLDSQLVVRGQRVEVGDTVGLVGNTGNARTTPPHLHFGIYVRGAVDPDPFLRPRRRRLPATTADLDLLGGWARTVAETPLYPSPDDRARDGARTLPAEAALRVMGGAGGWFRVRLPDGGEGWLPARFTESADRALRQWSPQGATTVHALPDRDAPVVADVRSGTTLPVLAAFAGYALVATPDGLRGWVSQQQ